MSLQDAVWMARTGSGRSKLVLLALAAGGVTVREVAAATEMTEDVVRSSVRDLIEGGLVEFDESSRRFRLLREEPSEGPKERLGEEEFRVALSAARARLTRRGPEGS